MQKFSVITINDVNRWVFTNDIELCGKKRILFTKLSTSNLLGK